MGLIKVTEEPRAEGIEIQQERGSGTQPVSKDSVALPQDSVQLYLQSQQRKQQGPSDTPKLAVAQ